MNHTVMQQFDQMYETMQLNQSSLQYIVKMFIQNFPAIFLIILLVIVSTYYIVKLRLNHLPIKRQVHFLTHLPIFQKIL
ncbi:hypothetical protein AAHB43_09050 [Staphylococcus pseudintermedius]